MDLSVRRLGVFGGAFDPPHRAHVALADTAIAQLELDRLLVVPTGQAWHRTGRPPSAGAHRVAMARLAFAGLDRAVVDDREVRRAGPSYTVDTLRELRLEFPQAQLFLLIGQDQAKALAGWREIDAIGKMAAIYVAVRGGAEGGQANDPPAHPALAGGGVLRMPPLDVSATAIRARIAQGKDPSDDIAPAVARYIAQHQLYRT